MDLAILFFICSILPAINAFLCDYQLSSCSKIHEPVNNCNNTKFSKCSPKSYIYFHENPKLPSGQLFLNLFSEGTTLELQTEINLPNEYEKSTLELSEFETVNNNIDCNEIKIDNRKLSRVLHNCVWDRKKNLFNKTFVFELKTQKDNSILLPKKLIFNIPDQQYLSDKTHVAKRAIFSYIDYSNIYNVVLKIQSLPPFYNVTQYKVEAFKEKDDRSRIIDVRLIPAENKELLEFEYLTYGEEGYHFFVISIISPECPEDSCTKTLTAKLHIGRKNPSLIIGIVGAGLLIPLFLYVYYIWRCKYQPSVQTLDVSETILLLFNPSYDQHNDVISALSKVIEQLTNIKVILDPLNSVKSKKDTSLKRCIDNLIIASYIIYITPPVEEEDISCLELDCMTYNFIKKELQDPYSERKVFVIRFSYTCQNVPSVFANCVKFELMKDFVNFLDTFTPINDEVEPTVERVCKDLKEKVVKAQNEMKIRIGKTSKVSVEI